MSLPDTNLIEPSINNLFINGGSMGQIIDAKNWSASPVGNPAYWPAFLISSIHTLLSTTTPAFLLWGPNNFCFYNDAFYNSFSAFIEPANQMGESVAHCLPHIFKIIHPLVARVLQIGEIINSQPTQLPLLLNGIATTACINFTLIPIELTSDCRAGILICCNQIFLHKAVSTPTIMPAKKHSTAVALAAITKANRPITHVEEAFLNLAKSQGGGHLILQGPAFIVEMVNDAYLKMMGKTALEIVGKSYFNLLPPAEDALQIKLHSLLQTGTGFTLNELPYKVNFDGMFKTLYLNFTYQPLKNKEAEVCGIIVIVTNVTEQVFTKFAITENDKQFRKMLLQSPVAIAVFRGSKLIIDTVNKQMLQRFWLKEEKDVVGKPFLEVFPEMASQKYPALLTEVLNNGLTLHDNEAVVELNGTEGKNIFYIDATYSPLFEIDGHVSGVMVTANDVTLTVKTREMLELQETQLRLSSDANGQATYEMDFTTDKLTHCKNLTKIYGIDPGVQLTHQEIHTFFHPEDVVEIVEKAYITSQITGVLVFDARVIWPDKTIHWIRTHGRMLYTQTNVLYKLVGTVKDITIEKEKDEYILKLAAIVESSIDAIVSTRLDGSIATWNDAATNMFGYTAHEMIGKPYELLFESAQSAPHPLIDRESLHQKFSFETTFIKKDNSSIDISCTVSPIKNSSGKIIGISKIARDITRQKLIQTEIKTSEARFRLLAEGMTQLIWTSNKLGVADYFNLAIHSFTGVSNEDIQKMGWIQLIHPDDRENNVNKWLAVVAAGTDFTIEHRILKHDGEYIWHLTRAVPQRDSFGNILSWVGSCTDINEIKENDQNRDFFISMASHELNTPVTTIKGYVEMMMEEYGSKGDLFFNKSMSSVHKQIKVLTNLIADLLDLSKIKAGVVVLYKEHFYSNDFINEIIKNQQAIHPDYTLNFIEREPVLLFADREKISRVLINILTNAIKYSPQNKLINIDCTVEAEQAIITVQDFGIGISKINQQKIFQRFFRISGKSEKTYPGFGIGLFIAAEIIEKHQGKLGVESVPGEGSIFNFSLPVSKILS